MANDGSVVISVKLDAGEAEAQLAKIKKKIIELETQLAAQQNIKTGLEQDLQKAAAAAEEAKKQLRELEQERARMGAANMQQRGTYSLAEMRDISSKIEAQKATVADLEKAYQAASAAVDKQNAKITETNAKLEAQRSIFGNIQQQAAEVGRKTRQSGSEAAEGMNEAGDATSELAARLDKVITRITNLAKRVFFFTVITRALRAFRDYVSSALKTSDEFNAAMAQLKGALATAFQPILSAAIPAIITLINVVTQAVQVIASLVSLLFGSTFAASSKAAEGLYNESKALNKVGGSAGKAAKALAAFDEINQLSSTTGGGGGSTTATPDFNNALADRIKEFLDGIDFTRLQESIARLKESFNGLVDTIKRGLAWCWDNILKPLAKWTIEELAPRLVDLLATAFDFLKAVLEKLGPVLEPLWNNILKPFFAALGDLILTGLDELIDLLDQLTKLINGEISWDEFIRGMDGVKWGLLALGGVAVLSAIGKFTTNIMKIPASIAQSIPKAAANLGKLAKTVALGALAVADAVILAYDVKSLKEAQQTYNDAMNAHEHETETALNSYKKLYEEKGKEVADEWAKMVYNIDTSGMELEEAQKAISDEIEKHWDGVPQNMWEGFKQGWQYYFGVNGVGLLQLLKDAWNGAIQGIKDLLGIHSPSTVFYSIGQDVAQGIWDGFTYIWSSFTYWLSTAWNNLTTWWNGLFLKAPTVQGGTTVSAGGFSNSSGSFSAPHLATGAVIPPNREFLAVLGDQKSGTNIEAPASAITEAVRAALDDGYGTATFAIYLDGEKIAQNTVNRINRNARGTGKLGYV